MSDRIPRIRAALQAHLDTDDIAIRDESHLHAGHAGANTGLGFETAKGLVHQGYRVVIAARNPDKGHAAVEALRGGCLGAQVRFEPLDLDSQASVRSFAARLRPSESSLDLLVNNAGVLALPTRELTQEGFERQLGVNYLGHFLLTSRLLPLLLASPVPRVVQLSSLAHLGSLDP